jgi:hypothetical protein
MCGGGTASHREDDIYLEAGRIRPQTRRSVPCVPPRDQTHLGAYFQTLNLSPEVLALWILLDPTPRDIRLGKRLNPRLIRGRPGLDRYSDTGAPGAKSHI